ncbi:alpha/beta fold hydrolase [Flavihumibacter petaseus]|uniref:AB hydrolase-1 domain-containing protein n=1 Tax=Flavihumibacter petaseus NBRC 106054 TaxID=1220578 RepID=A0A0E9N6W5_9BACT|nr:alpha/beta hydrolase [Flavihumibacter petaseus]GAO45569.1 hypothetical protein FPE01S_06_00600 [Flavihumibacter petaseus NBRC 106054]
MKLYFIPGLGADKRVFRHIHLPEPFEIVHVEWLKPEKNESLKHYAIRMAEQFDRSQKWGVVGLSFGGMLATEIQQAFHPDRTVLISSSAGSSQIPPYFRSLGALKLHRYLPIGIFKQASLAKRIFTTETDEDKRLLRAIIQESDPAFIRWAIGAIIGWKSENTPPDLFHIHGTRDNLLPIRYLHPTHVVAGGGHLMIMNRAMEVNQMLIEIFAA